jgi:hypothetical protein
LNDNAHIYEEYMKFGHKGIIQQEDREAVHLRKILPIKMVVVVC